MDQTKIDLAIIEQKLRKKQYDEDTKKKEREKDEKEKENYDSDDEETISNGENH